MEYKSIEFIFGFLLGAIIQTINLIIINGNVKGE